MSQRNQVYQWVNQIAERMPLGKWQAFGLALFSLGVVWSEHSWLSKVAEQLWWVGKADTVERRFQRWVANPRIDLEACCRAWSKWLLSRVVDAKRLILLVDLTKLGDRMDVLVVGLAYRRRCIPLAWRCLPGNRPWPKGQVALIADLLNWVAAGVPAGHTPLVEADRGIGNSSNLMKAVSELNWHFLFRVNATTRLRQPEGDIVSLADLIRPGKQWSGHGTLFPNSHPLAVWVHLIWRRRVTEPWCLVTNAADVTGQLYAARVWQEESFRDLKSGGLRWQRSLIRRPAHAERLLLVLTLAYAWLISLGTRVIRAGKATLRQLTRGKRRTYSVFRLGLRYLYHLQSQRQPVPLTLFFRPDLSHW
jgi:hypothetical protein